MPLRLATSLAASWSSGSSAERNLLAQRSMGPSMVTSTVSLALAESFSTSSGILMSCARAAAELASSSTNHVTILFMGSLLFLLVPGLVRWNVIDINLVNLRLRELELAASNAKGQNQLLLGGLPFGVLTLDIPVMNAPDDQGCTDGSRCRPTDQRLGKKSQPGLVAEDHRRGRTALRHPGQHSSGETFRGLASAKGILQCIFHSVCIFIEVHIVTSPMARV